MANNYYQKHKEGLRKKSSDKYQNLSEEENEKRQNKARESYHIKHDISLSAIKRITYFCLIF